MTPGTPAAWLPSLLLLLCLPGCVPLSGPKTVTGIVGRSLSVQCQYEEKYKTYDKYWCRKALWRCSETVTVSGLEEVRKGRVSIRDHPDNLTFTVTLEHLTLDDKGTYVCGIDKPWTEGFYKSFKVTVFIVPVLSPEPTSPPLDVTATARTTLVTRTTLANRSTFPVALPTNLASKNPTRSPSTQEDYNKHLSLPLLLSALALLLLLLLVVVSSLLAWRMFKKRVKAVEHPEQSQNFRQATEHSEAQYVNLQLHTLSLKEEPVPPSQVEVEYSTVAFPQEELHYSSLVFDSQKQDSNANRVVPRTPQGQESEYSVVQKPREGSSEPHL